jgi:nucleotide-binding universal stress UspA family protein
MSPAEGKIVAGVDGSGAATLAVRWAALEAAPRNIGLHLVHARLRPDGRRLLRSRASRALDHVRRAETCC